LLSYRCTPVSAVHSIVIAKLGNFTARLYFTGIAAADSWHCLPFEAAALRSVVFPHSHWIELPAIATARDELISVGVLVLHAKDDHQWCEIAPKYRYNRGDGGTSYGLPERNFPLGRDGPLFFGPRNQSTEIREKNRTTDSPKNLVESVPDPTGDFVAEREEVQQATSSQSDDDARPSGEAAAVNRVKTKKEVRPLKSGSDRFKRSVAELEILRGGKELVKFFGSHAFEELDERGAMWTQYLFTNHAVIEELIDQGWRLVNQGELGSHRTRVKWLNKRFHERK